MAKPWAGVLGYSHTSAEASVHSRRRRTDALETQGITYFGGPIARCLAVNCLPGITLLGILYDAAGKIDRAFDGIEIANIIFHSLFGTTAQCRGLD